MKSLKDLLPEEQIKKLAIPSNFRLGKEIAEKNGVEFIEASPMSVLAKVTGGQSSRKVEMNSTKDGLRWKCTCTNTKDHFCKHCVAVGLTLLKKA